MCGNIFIHFLYKLYSRFKIHRDQLKKTFNQQLRIIKLPEICHISKQVTHLPLNR